MAGPIAERRPTTRIQGAYLSGTATFGDWMVWSPGQDFTADDLYVQQSPVSAVDWANGAFLFAGILNRTKQDELLEAGQTVNLVTEGYCKRVNIIGVAFAGGGYPLGIGNDYTLKGVGQPLQTVGGLYLDTIPLAASCEAYTTPGEEGGVSCIVHRKGS